MKIKNYKEYRKDIKEIIKENNDIDTCRVELKNYYSKEKIFKESLIKRYNNICCNEKNLSAYITGIASGVVSGILVNLIGKKFNESGVPSIVLFIILSVLLIVLVFHLIYRYFIMTLNAVNDEIYIYPYEKLLIEKYLKDKYQFEVNPADVELIKYTPKENEEA